MKMGATFDVTGTYRYSLWRSWETVAPQVAFVMLNPSTADARTDDATIRRCIRFAQTWGYGSLEVVNLFALVATHPTQLQMRVDPVGAENDQYLLAAGQRATTIILAWGNWGKLYQRDQAVLQLLAPYANLYCLGMNQTGQPRHPLYVKAKSALVRFG
ncbi:DUF1643 domain-containing protein [Oculatella sp. LEGE 06141]|uniref:DUF1643 domain-containing protein n=1 Tax=Oculatella sp. LEGE 06141 TaxID=1828648 RepID=UPI0018822211|nr:DUF1643 domain-containing protein [Oculatella sp. LEGE 06141]MBE9177656.1 DUF1643 domain-containing protein [Oculatella sp. LEGE 06141]